MTKRLKLIALLVLPLGAWWAFHPKPCNVDADVRLPRATTEVRAFLETNCFACHDSQTKKGNLDLTALELDFDDAKTFATWIKVHDRVRDGEMPPQSMP